MTKLIISFITLLSLSSCLYSSGGGGYGYYPSTYQQDAATYEYNQGRNNYIYHQGKYKGTLYTDPDSNVSSFYPAGGGKITTCYNIGQWVQCN
jgi:hypothetical protein